MMKFFKDFWQEEEAMGTIEIVIIIAILVAIAMVFKDAIKDFAQGLINNAFKTNGDADTIDVKPGEIKDRTGLSSK